MHIFTFHYMLLINSLSMYNFVEVTLVIVCLISNFRVVLTFERGALQRDNAVMCGWAIKAINCQVRPRAHYYIPKVISFTFHYFLLDH